MQNISSLVDFLVPYAWCTECSVSEKGTEKMMSERNTEIAESISDETESVDSTVAAYLEIYAMTEDTRRFICPKVYSLLN